MIQFIVHYFLHFIFIGFIAYLYDKKRWKKYYLILLATMLVDVDHLWAEPIYEAGRCSINFHFLHSYWAILAYLFGCIFIRHQIIRLICIGLLFHMFTDAIDCVWNNYG